MDRLGVTQSARLFKVEQRAVLKLCEGINSARGLAIALMIRSGEWSQLLSLECNPLHYSDPSRFRDDYLVTEILKKNPRVPIFDDVARENEAIAKFHASESQCELANERLWMFSNARLSPCSKETSRVIHITRKIISDILGPLTKHKLGFVEKSMDFGPGSTTSLSGVVTKGNKYSHRSLDATSRVADFFTFCLPPGWRRLTSPDLRIRQASKLVTVPKNAKTDRAICVEPDLNIFVQKGIGALIRERLRLIGLNLQSQELNRALAARAVEFDLATVDLSAASDTLSREAVWLLLDPRWVELLLFARTDQTSFGGKTYELQKWSSMGNGYTFELETLIFFSLAKACCEAVGVSSTLVTAYGDDIIIPTAALNVLESTLDFLGFSVNRKKTFGEGPFRESCGKDFFLGFDVRPIYFRTDCDDFEEACYINANSLSRWATMGPFRDSRCLPAWIVWFSAVHPRERYRIPEGFGDCGFVSSWDASTPSLEFSERRGRGWCGYAFRYRSKTAVERVISVEGAYVSSLRQPSSFSKGREALRGRFTRARPKRGVVFYWPHVGAWI